MVMQTGASWVILGHSERRDIFGETDEVHLHIMGGGVVEVQVCALVVGRDPVLHSYSVRVAV